MNLVFLEASVPLTKTYALQPDGTILKTPYPFVWEFTSHQVKVTDLKSFHAALIAHAKLGHCLLKGQINKPLVAESRAGSTNTNDLTEFLVLDLDGLPDTDVTSFLKALGLNDYSHIIQWSASQGIENDLLRAHIFFLLDKPTAAPLLKQSLIQLNHEVPMLSAALKLTVTGNALSWPLDISACQNDKLIYIASPVLKGIKDPFAGKQRITLVKRKTERLSLSHTVNSSAKNKELTNKRLEELRATAGLPKRKTIYKMHGSVEVMAKPDACVISEMKQERGFVYFNLNGGDSWAYYHPETNPDYIFNFKGEPAYLTKELLPDYWEQLTSNGGRVNSSGTAFLTFCDRATGSYWRGTHDETTDTLELFPAKNETQVRHFAKQHGVPLGDFIPEWDLSFDPMDNVRVDFQNKTVNTFQPSKYMKAKARQVKRCPRTIHKVLDHVLGHDPDIVEHFINWVAYIIQYRDRTKTAWVLHGVPGTGKGILFANILRPIFGREQTTGMNMEQLNEPYNHWMQNSLIVFVDEVQTKSLINEKGVSAKLRNYITEEYVPIRAMYQPMREVRNFTNWIFSSNMPDAVAIEVNDRRHNVAKYQPVKLEITDAEIAQIETELQDFHDYLLYYPVSKEKAGSVLDTDDRKTMISISESSVDTVGSAILEGRFGFLMEQLPSITSGPIVDPKLAGQVEDYKHVLRSLMARTDKNNAACNISRDELRIIFTYVVGGMPATPNKFTSLLKHHRIHITDVWINTGTAAGKERGIKTNWTDMADWATYSAILNPPAPSAKAKTGTKKLAVVK